MVFVNLVGVFILAIGTLLYKFVYPKEKINLFFLLILISILPIISIFRTGAYESGDFDIHVYRTMAFFKSLSEGHFMPSWAGDLNATYGYPLFIFNYTLPYYLISFFHWIGFSFISSMKVFLATNLVLSGIFMFLFTKNIFKKNLPAFVSSVFYIFAPYHLIDVHFKVVIGEILFFTILPLAFLFLDKLIKKKSFFYVFSFALLFATLIISHLVIALFVGILMLFYLLFETPKNTYISTFLYAAAGFAISLLISLYQWLGPLILSQYSYMQNVRIAIPYSPTILDLLYSPWRFGFLFQGSKGELSFLLGYAQLIVIIALVILIFMKKNPKELVSRIIFWLVAFFMVIFCILPYSRPLWGLFYLISIAGPHRLLILTSFISSVLAGYLSLTLRRQWIIYALVIVAIGSTILNWGQRRVIPQITDSILQDNLWKSTSQIEGHFYANTKWVDIKHPWFSVLPESHLEILHGNGAIKNLLRTSTEHRYLLTAKTTLRIQENTLYYPGWRGFIDGKEISLFPSNNGIIQSDIPKGTFILEIVYQDEPTYELIKLVSIAALIISLAYLAISAIIQSRIK